MDVTVDAGEVVKRAVGAADRERLAVEAGVLAAAAHPGVVRLLSTRADALVLERVPGGDLAGTGTQALEVVAGWGAALATTVADLHDIGYAHGALRPEHVLFDETGRPVLCGFGGAVKRGEAG